VLVIGAIAAMAVPVDLVWHQLGRRRGARVLSGLCRLSLERDVCVRRTENLFLRHGVRALLVAKFLPGLTTVMPPMRRGGASGRCPSRATTAGTRATRSLRPRTTSFTRTRSGDGIGCCRLGLLL
jgi:hypothetical protein